MNSVATESPIVSHKYLFLVRGQIGGPIVDSWHKINRDNTEETKAVIFGMAFRNTANMGSGILCVETDEEISSEDMEVYLKSLSHDRLKDFIAQAKTNRDGPLIVKISKKK